MCDRSPCARDIAQALEREDQKWRVTGQLQDLTIAEFEADCARRLVRTLTSYLDHENRHLRLEVWQSLQSLAEAFPLTVAEYVPDIVDAVPRDGDSRVEHSGAVLIPILEAEVDLSDVVDIEYADALQQADPEVCRRAAAVLYGQFGSYGALERLEEMAEYETAPVADRAESELNRIVDHALGVLTRDAETENSARDAASIVRHVLYNDSERLTDRIDILFELLGTPQADIGITALAEFARRPEPIGQTTTERLVELVRVDELTVDKPAGTDTRTLSLRRAEDALEALIEADRTEESSAYIVSQADEWLSSDSVQLHEHALTQLRVLAERDPDAVQQHVDEVASLAESDSAESSLAGAVLNRYGQAKSDGVVSYLREVVQTRERGSAVAHLANAIGCLLYRPAGETSYRPLEIDEATDRALVNIADAVSEEQTLPVVWPKYEPRIVILIALELALRALNDGSDVIVFSPGGRSHWGNKGDLRGEFANYGLTDPNDGHTIPLQELIAHARIGDGSVVTMTDGPAKTRIIFSKRLEELRSLDHLNTIVFNLTALTKAEYETAIDDLVTDHDPMAGLPVYSNYTKHEFEERRAPRYGPPRDLDDTETLPGVDALESAAEGTANRTEGMVPVQLVPWFERATATPVVRVVGVDDGGLLNFLEPGYEASRELREYDESRAAGRVFSRQLMFERLPVPADRYDEWVRTQRSGYFGPRTIGALLDKLEERADDIIGRPAVAGRLFETVDALRRARDHIGEANPLYDELCRRLDENLNAGRSVAVFLPKATWSRALREITIEDGVVTEDDLKSDRVVFVDPNSARMLEDRDRLFMVGPQRPQYAGFYLHPSVEETVVLTYRGKWSWMIERDAARFIEEKNDAAPGLDYAPYPQPQIETELLFEPELTAERAAESQETEGVPSQESRSASTGSEPSSGGSVGSGADRQELAELFDHSGPIDYQTGGSDRYDQRDRREFEIETAEGQTFTRRDRVLRRRPDPSPDEDRFHWMAPDALREGDQVAIVEEAVLRRRWDEWLNEVYQDELGDTTTFEDLTVWHDSLTEILTSVASVVGVDDLTHDEVRRAITSRTSHIDREPATVWRWFESVAEADGSLNLARDPDLTIGPRRAEDIADLGEEFGHDDLTGENALRIEESMGRIRGTNSKQGHEFRAELKSELNSPGDSKLREHTTIYEIVSVTKV